MSPRSAIVIVSRRSTPSSSSWPVEGRDLADALRAEPGAGAVGGAAVERGAEHGHVVLPAAPHVLDVRGLEEGVDAGEVRELAAGERRDPPVDDGVRAGQAQLQAAGNLLLPPRGRQPGLRADGEAGLRAVVARGPREGRRPGCRPAGGGGATALLTSGAGRGAAGTTSCLPRFLSRRGAAAPQEKGAAACVSRTRPPRAGRNPRRASPARESGTAKVRGLAAGCSGCFRPVTPRDLVPSRRSGRCRRPDQSLRADPVTSTRRKPWPTSSLKVCWY